MTASEPRPEMKMESEWVGILGVYACDTREGSYYHFNPNAPFNEWWRDPADALRAHVASLESQLERLKAENARLKGFEEVTTELSNELDAIVEITGIEGNGKSISESIEAVFVALEADRKELERLKAEQLTSEERAYCVELIELHAFPTDLRERTLAKFRSISGGV